MQLSPPAKAPMVVLRDINGKPIQVGRGRRTLLAFFRDAACPFCNLQIYQLTQRYEELHGLGLDVVAVFTSPPEQVKRFVLARERPFPVAAEPSSRAYGIYGVRPSFWRKMWAVVSRPGAWIRGIGTVGVAGAAKGLAGVNTSNMMPADFLIDEDGNIAEAYYGRDAGDHIAFERIEAFLARGKMRDARRPKPA